jgi:hypothetical protein
MRSKQTSWTGFALSLKFNPYLYKIGLSFRISKVYPSVSALRAPEAFSLPLNKCLFLRAGMQISALIFNPGINRIQKMKIISAGL